jgi:RNA polymerase sigma-70 factor (ECF subfamily)
MVNDEDAALMCLVRDGDDDAFTRLFARWRAPLVRFTVRFVGDQARGEELAQDVLLKIYRVRERYVPSERFAAYLYRIATNHCLNELRRAEHRTPRVEIEVADEATADASNPTVDEMLQGDRLQTAVRAAVGRLPPNQRAALLLQHDEGLAYEEIADALETSVSAVKSLLNRARRALMQDLAPLLDRTPEVTA